MIAYRGPTLITEPELRWPIVLLAAAITALLAMLTAGLYYVVMTQSTVKSDMQPRLERALQPGQPEFEEFRQHIAIEQLVGTEKVHPFDTLAVAMKTNRAASCFPGQHEGVLMRICHAVTNGGTRIAEPLPG